MSGLAATVLSLTKKKIDLTKTSRRLELGPKEKIVALFEASDSLPLAGHAALCVILRSSRTESALRVALVDATLAPPVSVLLDAINDRHVACAEQPIVEEAPVAGEHPWHRGKTKTGGSPGFVQETPRPRCATCAEALVFAAQLAEDVFDCYFGDAGRVFVFVCPRGCGGEAVAQS